MGLISLAFCLLFGLLLDAILDVRRNDEYTLFYSNMLQRTLVKRVCLELHCRVPGGTDINSLQKYTNEVSEILLSIRILITLLFPKPTF